MRIGFNPNKDKIQEPNDFFHQVIVPVYIPNQEGYFKDSFKILQYSLESLFKTSHPGTFISLVDNGSSKEVQDYLDNLYDLGAIHELIKTSNIGKLNALLKGISGHDFSFVTLTDCDVLFLNSWQEATYAVFENFPKTGAVCPTPSSKSLKNYTFNIWFDMLFSKSLQFTKVKNPDALRTFANSVGNPEMYNSSHLEKHLTVANYDFKAVVGAGHFVTTYRKEVFEKNDINHSNFILGGDSEERLLDFPVVQKGMWRLSTEDNFTYHLGNVEEKWMNETLEDIKSDNTIVKNPLLSKVNSSKVEFFLKHKIFSKIITRKKIWYYCLRWKGLSKNEAIKYTGK